MVAGFGIAAFFAMLIGWVKGVSLRNRTQAYQVRVRLRFTLPTRSILLLAAPGALKFTSRIQNHRATSCRCADFKQVCILAIDKAFPMR